MIPPGTTPPGGEGQGDDPDDQVPGQPRPEGWLPPEARSWRHPSELHPTGPGAGAGRPVPGFPPELGGARSRHARQPHRQRWALAVVTGVGLGTVVAALALLWISAGENEQPVRHNALGAATTLTTAVGGLRSLPRAARAPERGLVALDVSSPTGVHYSCAVAIGPSGLVAAPADMLADMTHAVAVTPGGAHMVATLVGVDPNSGIALLRVPTPLPVPSFSDDATLRDGGRAMVVWIADPNPSAAWPEWSPSTISAVGVPVPSGDAKGQAAIVAAVGASPDPGAALVTPGGAVLGILDSDGDGDGDDTFLPEQLVVGVSDELAAGHVEHGWLDISGRTDALRTRTGDHGLDGVLVDQVKAVGASAGDLRAGDVIVAVSGEPVRSLAELRTRLYVLQPGTEVAVTVVRHGRYALVDVALSASP